MSLGPGQGFRGVKATQAPSGFLSGHGKTWDPHPSHRVKGAVACLHRAATRPGVAGSCAQAAVEGLALPPPPAFPAWRQSPVVLPGVVTALPGAAPERPRAAGGRPHCTPAGRGSWL